MSTQDASLSPLNLLGGSHLEIQVIDMKNLWLSGDSAKDEMEKVHIACRDWGFFQLINRGVPCSLIERMKSLAREFFDLPLETKQRDASQTGSIEGYGQAFVLSEDQTLDWGDMLLLTLLPAQARNMRFWPTLKFENFRETLEAYSMELQKIAANLLGRVARNLELRPETFNEIFGSEPLQTIRLNYYPPCPQPELVLGLSPHSDSGGITPLVQEDDEMQGLNIRKDEFWISVKPLPTALIVNMGDSLEIMSNGRYKSIEHRAVTNSNTERISIATFYNPRYSAQIGPCEGLVDEEHPRLYKSLSNAEYLQNYQAHKLQGKRAVELAKLGPSNI